MWKNSNSCSSSSPGPGLHQRCPQQREMTLVASHESTLVGMLACTLWVSLVVHMQKKSVNFCLGGSMSIHLSLKRLSLCISRGKVSNHLWSLDSTALQISSNPSRETMVSSSNLIIDWSMTHMVFSTLGKHIFQALLLSWLKKIQ